MSWEGDFVPADVEIHQESATEDELREALHAYETLLIYKQVGERIRRLEALMQC